MHEARHVERVVSRRDDPSWIWANVCIIDTRNFASPDAATVCACLVAVLARVNFGNAAAAHPLVYYIYTRNLHDKNVLYAGWRIKMETYTINVDFAKDTNFVV